MVLMHRLAKTDAAHGLGNNLVQINQQLHHNNASPLKRSANPVETGKKAREKATQIAPDWCVFA
ncbi:MAG: hypothetical protein ACMZI0_09885 [Symbiopectobacterium sp.]|uniref:hypothetical protein n=1 Tax=Symbiopectobacterium sp. TaxID=2952789 RepID=UPI0039EC4F90